MTTALAVRPAPSVQIPTLEAPIPSVAETPGYALLLSGTAREIAAKATVEAAEALATILRPVLASLTPAKAMDVGQQLEGLSLHCKSLRRKEFEQDIWVNQWLQDLEGYPLDLIAEGCRIWRNTPNKGDLTFPSPGQFKAPIQPVLDFRRRIAKRAIQTAEAMGIGIPAEFNHLRTGLN